MDLSFPGKVRVRNAMYYLKKSAQEQSTQTKLKEIKKRRSSSIPGFRRISLGWIAPISLSFSRSSSSEMPRGRFPT